MSIAISGASGHLGRRTAELVLDRLDDASELVLLTRTPAKLDDLAARGAVVREATFDDPAGLVTALEGVERFLIVSTDAVGSRVPQQEAAVAAAKSAGVTHLLYTSAPKPSAENPAIAVADHLATEQAIEASGLDWTFLRNNLYAEFQIGSGAPAVASGQLYTNAGDAGTAYVTREDCAAAAAAALVEGAPHVGQAYEISGPEAVTQERFAELLTEVTGQPVAVVQVDDAGLAQGLAAAGLPEPLIPVLVTFGTATREGYLDHVSTAVADLTGNQPTPLADVLAAAKAELLGTDPAPAA